LFGVGKAQVALNLAIKEGCMVQKEPLSTLLQVMHLFDDSQGLLNMLMLSFCLLLLPKLNACTFVQS
jgi:hypothetical protein